LALPEDDTQYWEPQDTTPKSPKHQKVQVEEESLNDSVSTIKTAISTKKPACSALKSSTSTGTKAQSDDNATKSSADSAMAMSHRTTLSQLTKQVSEMKQSQKAMLDHFDKLAKQMALLITNSISSPKNTQPKAMNPAR